MPTNLVQRRTGQLVIAALLGIFIAKLIPTARGCSSLRPVGIGEAAPAFSLPKIGPGGQVLEEVQLSELQGSVVLVDFWATWCGPCRDSMPILDAVHQEYSEQGLEVLSINVEGSSMKSKARAVADELSPHTTLLVDTKSIGPLYKVVTIPHMLLIDRQGRVQWVKRGFSGSKALRRELRKAIEPHL